MTQAGDAKENGEFAVALGPRLAALRAAVMTRGGSWVKDANPFLMDVAIWRAAGCGRSRVQQRAACLLDMVRLAKIDIYPGWTLAGEHLTSLRPWFMLQGEPDAQDLKRLDEYGLSEAEKAALRRTVRLWNGCGEWSPSGDQPQYVGIGEPASVAGKGSWGQQDSSCVYWGNGWIENHSVRDYAKVLRMGYGGIRREVESLLADADVGDPGFPQKENFWRAALSVCDAGMLLGARYAELSRQKAGATADHDERCRLLRMAEACSRVPAEGARSFFEATQSLWLAHILTCGEDSINANSFGRLDQLLHPYYLADVQAGRLARADALELMEELGCKLYLDYDVQAITLGGVTRDGRDAVNDLSYIILEATRNVGFVRDVSVRLHRGSPVAFVRLAADMMARGGGIPFLFNDDCFIKALTDRGIALDDARDYAPIGCIELTVPGRANPHAVSGWFNIAKCLELALFGGVDPAAGRQLGPATPPLTELGSFDEFYAAYARQVDHFARLMVYHCNRGELAQRERGPLPCWSVLTDDCIARGRDITDGGAVYNYHSIALLGTANVADAFMAVRKLVFEERRVSAGPLLDALRGDFVGEEPLRQMLITEAPKYGNDVREVDLLARRIDEDFIALMDSMRSPLGGRYFVHLFSFLCNVPFGKTVGATPDGRRASEPLAYSVSAHQGRDQAGATAMLNSLARLPHDQAAGASAAIVELDSVVVQGAAGVERLVQLIQGAIGMGVGQLQWNVTTVERLQRAQKEPEQFGNIAVRVAGFSQMFKLIDKELQDHIIARTKHRG